MRQTLYKVLSDCTSSLLVFFCLKIQTAAFKEPARLMTQLIKQCVATKMMFIQEHSGGSRYWSLQAVGMWHTMLTLPRVSGSSDRAAPTPFSLPAVDLRRCCLHRMVRKLQRNAFGREAHPDRMPVTEVACLPLTRRHRESELLPPQSRGVNGWDLHS